MWIFLYSVLLLLTASVILLLLYAISHEKKEETVQFFGWFSLIMICLSCAFGLVTANGERNKAESKAKDEYYSMAEAKEAASASQAKTWEGKEKRRLTASFQKIADKADAQVAIVLLDKDGNKLVDINGADDHTTASTYKPLVFTAALRKIEEGNFPMSEDQLDNYLQPAIRWSDNNSAAYIADNVMGWNTVESEVHEMGIESFDVKTETDYSLHIHADDLARFYYLLDHGKLLNENHTKKMLNELSRSWEPIQFIESTNKNFKYQNKYGNLDNLYNESGIITTPSGKKYYLAVMTENWRTSAIQEWYTDLARSITENLD